MSKATSSDEKPLIEIFEKDKQATLNAVQEFLKSPQTNPTSTNTDSRKQAQENVKEGKFTEALQNLERLRDEKSGIVITKIIKNDVHVIIRDARSANNPPVRETEAFEMQYLNAVRAGMDIAEIEKNTTIQTKLQDKAQQFMENFHQNNKDSSQEKLSKLLKTQIKELAKMLEDNGISDAYKKLNIAKDFQNFNDTHSNIVTVSSIKHNEQTHIVIEAEVAMKGLTTSQKTQYDLSNQPSWYKAMPEWEQKLCNKYVDKILGGQHVMPTQLRQIPGMKNAFEKITAIYNTTNQNVEILHTSKHAGTLASLARAKNARQDITDENAKQAQEWIGKNKILHCNTFNSGPLGAGDDPEIVKRTKKAMDKVRGKQTNTAFNNFRYLGFANDLNGAKNTLKMLSASLLNNKQNQEYKKIKSYLKPKGFFGRLFRKGTPEKEINNLLQNLNIDDTTKEIIKVAIDLKLLVEKADSVLRFGDAENVSLATSTKLNQLTNILSGLEDSTLKKEEILNMCASGKDRTGLAEHDQSARVIADKIGAPISDIDKQLLASGHTAQQAGGINAGGGTIGCYGTKSENRAGIPVSRKKNLEAIVEVTANSNKIKGKSKAKDHKDHYLAQASNTSSVQTLDNSVKTGNNLGPLSPPKTPVNNSHLQKGPVAR